MCMIEIRCSVSQMAHCIVPFKFPFSLHWVIASATYMSRYSTRCI